MTHSTPRFLFRFFVSNRNRNSHCMNCAQGAASNISTLPTSSMWLSAWSPVGRAAICRSETPQALAELEASFPCCLSLQAQMARLGWCRTPVHITEQAWQHED